MPSPILPSQICATVPSPSASFCEKFKLVFLQLPNYICQIFSYMFNEDGTVTTEFKDAASPFPAGFILAAVLDSPPMGWLICNGQAVSRTTYAVLFAAIGTRFGSGDGSTTFNVPDLRGRAIIGVSGTYAMGAMVGLETHTLTQAEMPTHHHVVTGRNFVDGADNTPNLLIADDDWGSAQTSIDTSERGSGQAHNNMQPSFAANWMIKY